MKRGVMKHGSRRSAPLLTVARHRPPSPAPVSSHLPKHHRSIVQLVASSARARSPRPARFTPHTAAVHSPTDSLSPRSPPPHQPLPPVHHRPSGPGRHHRTSESPPSDGRPSLSTLLSSAPPYLTRPLPLVHHSFHFLLLALPLTFLCPRVRPGCRTRCNSPPSLHIKHSSLRRVLCSGLHFHSSPPLTSPLRSAVAVARPASARERVLPSLSLRCHHVRHVRRPSAPLHAATTAASCRS